MRSHTYFLRQGLGLLILFSVASLFFLCTTNLSMSMDNMGQASPCGMSHNADLCPMALNGRLSFWQTVIVPTLSAFDALVLLAFFAAAAFFWSSTEILEATQSKLKPAYNTENRPIFDYFHQLFSNGILHPKIY